VVIAEDVVAVGKALVLRELSAIEDEVFSFVEAGVLGRERVLPLAG
jgi:hypothetical protein